MTTFSRQSCSCCFATSLGGSTTKELPLKGRCCSVLPAATQQAKLSSMHFAGKSCRRTHCPYGKSYVKMADCCMKLPLKGRCCNVLPAATQQVELSSMYFAGNMLKKNPLPLRKSLCQDDRLGHNFSEQSGNLSTTYSMS